MLIRRMDASFTPTAGLTFTNALPYPQQLGADLIGWWAADQSVVETDGSVTSLTDLSGNGITLTPGTGSQSIAYVADGQNGLAYIQNQQTTNTAATAAWLESAADLSILKWDYSQAFSVAFCISRETFTTDTSPHALMAFYESAHGIGWRFYTEYGSVLEWTFSETNGTAVSGTNQNVGTAPTAGTTCSIVITYDGSGNSNGVKLYLNGALYATAGAYALNGTSETLLYTNQKLYLLGLGASVNNSPDKFFEASLVKGQLTAAQVTLFDKYFKGKWAIHS